MRSFSVGGDNALHLGTLLCGVRITLALGLGAYGKETEVSPEENSLFLSALFRKSRIRESGKVQKLITGVQSPHPPPPLRGQKAKAMGGGAFRKVGSFMVRSACQFGFCITKTLHHPQKKNQLSVGHRSFVPLCRRVGIEPRV